MTPPAEPTPSLEELRAHPAWRALPWLALALLLGAQLWLLPYPRVYLLFGRVRLGALLFVAALTLLSFLVRSRSVRIVALLLAALLFARFVQLHQHLAQLYALRDVAAEACRGVPDSEAPSPEALERALVAAGRPPGDPMAANITCGPEGTRVFVQAGYFGGFETYPAFDAQGRLIGF
ncbi:hypothetical protein FGE12_29700 [Aggregicoccus sp. 17bor-14]|uniref:hypothetical protein n=1 Tax=Myxococcaceae TaxID=31 RepID=UPI00129C78C3|nr:MULTISPECIES: hypothetical protein [Myxococcaceae]MBF5046630.1 hypothetical protein [Simulacricoccus sp. 17bor-14]MRI92340.1 hypothetical protein [Aggregicoccus sp. 17bor-14]